MINVAIIDHSPPPHGKLSGCEVQVLLRLVQGETICHIAERLSLAVRTVRTSRSRETDKLGPATNRGLTCDALKSGLIHSTPHAIRP